ncbi:mobilization protein, partial [Clostridioides difficile]|nr:mobilization protein [Clostridioides difficile]
MEELEKSEQNRNERAKSLVNKLEGSTSNFNNKLDVFEEKTKHARLNFETTAKHYIKRLDEDNLKLDFQKAIQD